MVWISWTTNPFELSGSWMKLQYVQGSYQVFTYIRQRMREGFEKLAQEGVKSVALYKANVDAKIAYLALLDVGLELVSCNRRSKAWREIWRLPLNLGKREG